MKFSIITCTYNSAKYLQQNIDSIKSQTCQNFEHIFIDGFSTDETIGLIEKYRREFPEQVKVFKAKPKGIANAMNRGVEKASGEYLIHLHSDDSFYNNNVLQEVDSFIKIKKRPDWIYGKAKFIDTKNKKSRIIPHRKIYQKIKFWLLLLTNYIPHQSVFLKKSIFQEYGMFDEQFKNSMDYDFWLRLAKNNVSGIFIDKIICNFSIRDNSQSAIGKSSSEHVISYKKYISSTILRFILKRINLLDKKRKLL